MSFSPSKRTAAWHLAPFLGAFLLLAACGPAVDPDLNNDSTETIPTSEAAVDPTEQTDEVVEESDSESVSEEDRSAEKSGDKISVVEGAASFDANNIEVGFTEDGHPYMGDPSAPVVIKEFSDFQCPFCERFYSDTLTSIEEELLANGTAVLIFYDFPLASLHPQAAAAASAARCAGEQGAESFWAMHDQLFSNLESWSVLDPSPIFSSFAADMGLDLEDFNNCISVDRYADQINADLELGTSNNINGTPSFLINEQLLIGAQPAADFLAAVDLVLNGGQLASAEPVSPPQQPRTAPTPAATSDQFAADLGDPSAPVTIVEFTDYECPFCSRYSLETMPILISELIDSGRVYYQLKDLPLEQMHPNARLAAAAARCAGDQGDYWTMHDLLFGNQEGWSELTSEGLPGEFSTYASEIGIDVEQFVECLASGDQNAGIDDNVAEARSLGIGGTPFFLVDGYPLSGARPFDHFEYAVSLAEEGRLAEAFAPSDPQPEPEPAGPQEVPIGDAYFIGEEDAPVTIVEYTDYQCPFCSRHFEQTFPLIVENYVDTGLVRYVFKDFPLNSIHPQASKAAEAARCAKDQGQFLEMHDLLFERQSDWGGRDPSDKFQTYAIELGLDAGQFEECLTSGTHAAAVDAELNEGIQLGVTGTPAFFINGYPVSGAQPYSLFEQAVTTLVDG